jgi:hypothetical protein
VIGNTLTDNNIGIDTWYSFLDVVGNTVHRNAVYGISAYGFWMCTWDNNDVQLNGHGFYLRYTWAEYNTVASNTVTDNTLNGIYLDNGIHPGDALEEIEIHGNTISDNGNYGVYAGHSGVTRNMLYDNAFERNAGGNAYEVAGVTGNRWNSDTVGNFWDDWALNPGYPEGIYYIDGPGDGIDSLPGSTAGVPYTEEPAPSTWGGIKSISR